MGLDLVCGDIIIKMGSYSSVQEQRALLLKGYIMWLHDQGIHETAKTIGKCVKKRKDGFEIDYKNLDMELLMPGMKAFIFHSDCEGEWSVQDAKDILESLEELRPFFQKIQGFDYYCIDDRYHLEDILEKSVQSYRSIQFC
jgi:hypothetical protein